MSKIKSQISFYDLTGGINNVDTFERFNSSPRKTETPDMLNVEYYKLGGIKSMEGNTQVGEVQSSGIVGGWEYSKGNNRYMVIALRTGELKVYDNSINDFVKVYKFPNQSSRVSFCNMNNGVVATNGIDDPVFYEYGRRQSTSGTVAVTAESNSVVGTSTKFETQLAVGMKIEIDGVDYKIDTITDDTHLSISPWDDGTLPVESASGEILYIKEISQCNAILTNSDSERPSDWYDKTIRGSAIQFYAGRLWIGGKDGLFYSGLGEYDKWDTYYNDAGEIAEVYNDTSSISALGLYSDFMLIHKEYNTYLLTMTGDSDTIQIKPYSNITCGSQQSWVVSNTKYFVYSKEHMDIFPLSQRTIFSDRYLGEAITDKVRNIFQNLNDNETTNIFCLTLPRKRWMLFYMPMISGSGSNYALIFDFQTKSFLARQLPNSQQVTIAFNYNSNVYIGTNDGRVLKEFAGKAFGEVRDSDGKIVNKGLNINAYYKSPWFDWADNYTHSFSEFVISLSPEVNNNFKLRTFKDGDSQYEDRVINDGELVNTGLIWDGGEQTSNYYYIYKTFPVYDDEDNVDSYLFECRIPNPDPLAIENTVIEIEENVYISCYKDDVDLVIKKRNPIDNSEVEYDTIEDYYVDGYDMYIDGHNDDNNTMWDNDVWTAGRFNSIRMLLPNNVFEQFQLEIYIDGQDNQGFAIEGYSFRRLETEEAPW